ncbi:MAG: hypothetical protein RLY16_178 [Bacteroidota bacterium]|jgi:glyoxylase I family protein
MIPITGVHHIAIICSNYTVTKHFYTEILGLEIVREVYRSERDSYKLDLAIEGQYCIEIFSFPNPPARPSKPESCGLRHLAFATKDLDGAIAQLTEKGVICEPVRVDAFTNKRFTFFADPDDLPLELYEAI